METGRSRPTPGMILRLSEQLDVPLRERNALLLAGGYAPAYPEHSLDEPELTRLRAALRQILTGHQPYPALVVNRWWEMLDGNAAVAVLTEGCDPALLTPPVNALRASLHPDGMAPRIVNLAQWRAHILERRHRQVHTTRGKHSWPSCRPTRGVWPLVQFATACYPLSPRLVHNAAQPPSGTRFRVLPLSENHVLRVCGCQQLHCHHAVHHGVFDLTHLAEPGSWVETLGVRRRFPQPSSKHSA